jgi:hypothetical protein
VDRLPKPIRTAIADFCRHDYPPLPKTARQQQIAGHPDRGCLMTSRSVWSRRCG